MPPCQPSILTGDFFCEFLTSGNPNGRHTCKIPRPMPIPVQYPAKPRRTKIVATIGPASDSPEVIRAMIQAGMNVARLNLSHGTLDEHKARIGLLRDVAAGIGRHIAIMIDTRGIEIRTGMLAGGKADLDPDDVFSLYMDDRPGDDAGVSVTYSHLAVEVQAGTPILLDDGAIELEVREVQDDVIRCVVIHLSLIHI